MIKSDVSFMSFSDDTSMIFDKTTLFLSLLSKEDRIPLVAVHLDEVAAITIEAPTLFKKGNVKIEFLNPKYMLTIMKYHEFKDKKTYNTLLEIQELVNAKNNIAQ